MIKLTCKHCERYLGEVETLVGEILCGRSTCRGGNQFKIVTNNVSKMVNYTFTNAEKPPKKEAKV